ncbi:nucleolar complex protein 2 [Diutina catenulata]
MAKTSKSTKKFQAKHLKQTLEHRKKVQAHRKLTAGRKKKTDEEPKVPSAQKEVFEDMSVDQFFDGGFEVPKEKKSKKQQEESEESESSEDEEDEKMADDDSDASSSEEEDEEMMKRDMEQLKEKDPEFYKYLENNDRDLLDFKGVNPLEAMEDDSEEEDDEETHPEIAQHEVDADTVDKWEQTLKKQPSAKLVRQVCAAFKSAVNTHEGEPGEWTVSDPDTFSKLMVVALKGVPQAMGKLVRIKKGPQGSRVVSSDAKNFPGLSNFLRDHAEAMFVVLEDIANTDTAALVLSGLHELAPFYVPHKKLLKKLLKEVINLWSSTSDQDTQIAAFAFLNAVAREYPQSVLEPVLRLAYSTLVQNSRKMGPRTVSLINFCKNSAAELYGIDPVVGYQVGFEYVRQAAIHLRNSLTQTSNAKNGYKIVYNWQFCNSLDFWSRVVALHCSPDAEKESPLRQLIYPLVQVTLGTIRLIPTAQFFPLRFYLIRSLLRVAQGTGVYIPLYPLIGEVLTSTTITKIPKSVNVPIMDFDTNIKAAGQYLGTKVYQDGVAEQFIELTAEFFSMYARSIAFPELATPAVLQLRRFVKSSKNPRFNKQLNQLVEKLNANAALVTQKRSGVEYGPSNKGEVAQFMTEVDWEQTPMGQYTMVQRRNKEERQRILREAMEAEDKDEEEEEEEEEEEDDVDIDLSADEEE